MGYRENRLARAERLREWADKRQHKSEAALQAGEDEAEGRTAVETPITDLVAK